MKCLKTKLLHSRDSANAMLKKTLHAERLKLLMQCSSTANCGTLGILQVLFWKNDRLNSSRNFKFTIRVYWKHERTNNKVQVSHILQVDQKVLIKGQAIYFIASFLREADRQSMKRPIRHLLLCILNALEIFAACSS